MWLLMIPPLQVEVWKDGLQLPKSSYSEGKLGSIYRTHRLDESRVLLEPESSILNNSSQCLSYVVNFFARKNYVQLLLPQAAKVSYIF